MSNTKTYAVLSNLRHDGKLYEAGDTVELTDGQAAALLPVNVVKLVQQAEVKIVNTVDEQALQDTFAGSEAVIEKALTIPVIKAKLDEAGIPYPSGADKATLLALLPVGA